MKLLAKSPLKGGETLGLHRHLVDTDEATRLVFKEGSRWRAAWVRFFRIAEDQEPRFWKMLRVAALFHDLGKANADFQRAVSESGQFRQSVRHEHLSALILCLPKCRRWLESAGINVDLVTAAVLSHHIKAAATGDYKWCNSLRPGTAVKLFLEHEDVRLTLEAVAAVLGIGIDTIPSLPNADWGRSPWNEVLDLGRHNATALRRSLAKDPIRRRTLAALKAALIVADSVASAVFRERKSMSEWLERNAHSEPITPEEIEKAILEPRAKAIEAAKGKPFIPHQFQELCENEGPRTLLIAACGAGKTIAAWKWAKHQAVHREFGRVIFLYPTRGTATEGFRDYVGWAPEGEGTLLHGTSGFELESMADNPPESQALKDITKAEAEARMFALGLWRFRFFSATVDQFLSFMENRYQSLLLLPALADSVLVVDEVHSYDRRMFVQLKKKLEEFDVPVLCMTATLPEQRKAWLLETGMQVFPRPEHADQLEDLKERADAPRYKVTFERDAGKAIHHAIEAYRSGRRVLIVVNRVARCIEVAREIEEVCGHLPYVYHSRFILKHRQERHKEVVRAFQGSEPAIAVTTQVCEMSLDLDAQTLVTEVAPITALVQRFGRANRHLREPHADVVVYWPSSTQPYDPREMDYARAFAERLAQNSEGGVSQAYLAQELESEKYSVSESASPHDGSFLSGGYYAVPGSFREEDDYSCQGILEKDLKEVEQLHARGERIDGFLLPFPKRQALEIKTSLPRYLRMASGKYDPLLGLEE